MSISAGKLLTMEAFAATEQDDDWTEELIDGVVHRSPPGRALHGIVCSNVAEVIWKYSKTVNPCHAAVGSGLVVARDPDSVLCPDIQFFSAERPPNTIDGWPTVPPVLVVEIVDGPADYSHIMMKVPLYLAFGVELIWVARTAIRDVQVHRLCDQRKPFDRLSWANYDYQNAATIGCESTLDGGTVLSGFSCKVAVLFD